MKIRNWGKFQHFKDRRPPWIKVYREILDDPDWHDLDGKDAKTLLMFWLIASEDETKAGKLPDAKTLAFRLRVKESEILKSFKALSKWLDASTVSCGYQIDINKEQQVCQVDAPETETKEEKRHTKFDPLSFLIDESVDGQVAKDWIDLRDRKKAVTTETAIIAVKREAEKSGRTMQEVLSICCQRGWAGFMASWLEGKSNNDQPSSQLFPNAL